MWPATMVYSKVFCLHYVSSFNLYLWESHLAIWHVFPQNIGPILEKMCPLQHGEKQNHEKWTSPKETSHIQHIIPCWTSTPNTSPPALVFPLPWRSAWRPPRRNAGWRRVPRCWRPPSGNLRQRCAPAPGLKTARATPRLGNGHSAGASSSPQSGNPTTLQISLVESC